MGTYALRSTTANTSSTSIPGCGACTVLIDGRRVNSCLILAIARDGGSVTTIEGLGSPDDMHPMQRAFVDCDALQCGYCTPGQICSAVALLAEGHAA